MNNTVTRQVLGKVMITSKGEYDSSKSYEILDVVTYQGSSYLSKKYNNDSLPTNASDWQLLAQKGDTYELSEEDLQRIAEQITSNANSAFNQNVKEKTDSFNSNATEKLGTYNSNHTAKLKEYNDNATSKLSAYNTNTVAKTTEYNSNHTDKLNAYNTNASNKVTAYNTNADTRLEEYNTNADNKIAEYDEHSKELNNKIVSTRNELERLKSNVLNTGEDTDTFIHLEDSAMAELQEIKVDGVLSQETTNGYQLFDVSKVTTISNGTIENEIVTSNVLSGNGQGVTYNFPSITLTANTTYYIFADIRIKSGTGYINGINNGVVSWEKVSFPSLSNNYNTFISKYTPTENENIYAVYLGFNNANNLIINIQNVMITTNRNATYEPYTGGKSPNPDYPQEIKTITNSLKVTSCGKNLFSVNIPTITRNGITVSQDDNGIHVQGTSTNISNFLFPTKILNRLAGKTITLTCADLTNSNIQNISFKSPATNTVYCAIDQNVKSRTYKLPIKIADDTVFSIYILSNMTINSTLKIQVEIGNKSEYENYVESQIQAKLPEGEFIGKLDETYKDTLRAEYFPEEGQYHWMLDKKVKKFNNWLSRNYVISNTYTNDTYVRAYFSGGVPDMIDSTAKYNNTFQIGYFVNIDNKELMSSKTQLHISILRSRLKSATPAEITNWLIEHNVEAYYATNKPYTLDLGVIDMPLSYNEVTNIFTDSDLLPTINAKYYRVFDKTIQNTQINEKTLKQEITDLNATVSALDNRLKALETKTVEEPTESEGTV